MFYVLLAITAAQRLCMDSTKYWHLFTGIQLQVLCTASQNWKILLGFISEIGLFTSHHKFSIGLRFTWLAAEPLLSMFTCMFWIVILLDELPW